MNTFTRIRTWWNNNHEQIEQNLEENIRRLDREINRLIRNTTRLMIIGIILNIIANYFYPDFPERFPVIYGWFDGWLQLGEFAIKTALSGVYSLLTGNWPEFCLEYNVAFKELWQQFVAWLVSISF